MITIRISEKDQKGSASLSFDHGQEYPINVTDPFSKSERDRLEWYYGEYIQHPFAQPGDEQGAAQSIREYGHKLFNQVFGAKEIFAEYCKLPADGFRIEIAGSLDFHGIHWETMWDPTQPIPLTHYAAIVRRNLLPTPQWAAPSAEMVRILLVVSRPDGVADVGYRTISAPLMQSIKNAPRPVRVDVVRPGSLRALNQHLQAMKPGYYHVLHFDGHGEVLKQGDGNGSSAAAYLRFEGTQPGKMDLVPAQQFADVVSTYKVPIVILNACESGKQVGDSESSLASQLVQGGAQNVIAMTYSCSVTAARMFMTTLYQELLAGSDLEAAVLAGRQTLWQDKNRASTGKQVVPLEDWLLPVVYQNQPGGITLRDMTEEEARSYYLALAQAHPYPEDFHGRDGDVLEIERQLLADDASNLLYIQGDPRSGVSALLNYLAAWWQATGFCRHVFFFGQDDRNKTCQEILERIAGKLLSGAEYGIFLKLQEEARPVRLRQIFTRQRHLIVVDGGDPAGSADLGKFITQLRGTKCIVLFGGTEKPAWFPGQPYLVARLPEMPFPPDPSARADVFLAETNETLVRPYVDPLRTELVMHKFSVFHEKLGPTRIDIEKRMKEVLEYTKLAIFVVGESSSRGPEGGASVLEIQYDCVIDKKIPCLVWLTAAQGSDGPQRSFFEKLRAGPNRDLLNENQSLEKVRQRALEILSKPAAAPAPPAGQEQVYLYFGPEEPKFLGQPPPIAALEIRNRLLKLKKFRVAYPLLDPTASKKDRREIHQNNLRDSQFVVLYWNRASERWVREQIAEILKKSGGSRSRNAVLITGDVSDAKLGFDDANFRPFNDPEKLIEYLAGNQ
jgi:hypothetical protein